MPRIIISSSSSSSSSSFRLCIALLLSIQALCWLLTLLDLFVPGKPLSIFRHSTDILSQLFSRRSSAMLYYKEIRARL
ncbi:hypothetical protein K505DRAFT_323712 [Melanomma pulvis-pyrius CBS 109.77]|uniref:Uncharacterized protein n=1 Tax=Melanomma pulvis-pyrius CBS 109.77 TaxID=1314802 RepID=A0A6A6XI80_9PLEO|nr:hypothetical protein K505DRAFT_323712 [Melanomma pulvis-pyrius CBS 109.77]